MPQHFAKDSELLRSSRALKFTTSPHCVAELEAKGWAVIATYGPFEDERATQFRHQDGEKKGEQISEHLTYYMLGQPEDENERQRMALAVQNSRLADSLAAAEAESRRQREELAAAAEKQAETEYARERAAKQTELLQGQYDRDIAAAEQEKEALRTSLAAKKDAASKLAAELESARAEIEAIRAEKARAEAEAVNARAEAAEAKNKAGKPA